MKVYLDNAASTPLDPTVLEFMMPYFQTVQGNPSSIHAEGRMARSAIEIARKNISNILNTSPSEIFFTSGGTEANNTALISSIKSLGIKHVITSPIEHHAVLHCLEFLQKHENIQLSVLELDAKGNINYEQLASILYQNPRSLVSLMHANNEIGNINNLQLISELCQKSNSIFHSDTVQTVGHYPIDLKKLDIDFIVGSAHKFHGPKGIGFIYINGKNKIQPYIHGGSQERNMRGGTENISGIIGMSKALELSQSRLEEDQKHIMGLKKKMIEGLKITFPEVGFNGESESIENSLYTVLNVNLPYSEENDMLLFNLDINNICASGGSACSSGTDIGSHVLKQLNVDKKRGHIRFSFSRLNTISEIEYTIDKLSKIIKK